MAKNLQSLIKLDAPSLINVILKLKKSLFEGVLPFLNPPHPWIKKRYEQEIIGFGR
jgi:hypothetical protein